MRVKKIKLKTLNLQKVLKVTKVVKLVDELKVLFPKDRDWTPDFRQNALGTLWYWIYERLGRNFEDSRLSRKLPYSSFSHFFEGWNSKSFRETIYSDEVFGNFISKYLSYIFAKRRKTTQISPTTAALLIMATLDACLHPRPYFGKIRKICNTDEVKLLEAAEALLDIIIKIDASMFNTEFQELAKYAKEVSSDPLISNSIPRTIDENTMFDAAKELERLKSDPDLKRNFMILIYSMAKATYDGAPVSKDPPWFIEDNHEMSAIPVFSLNDENINENEILWMQFNRIAFTEDSFKFKFIPTKKTSETKKDEGEEVDYFETINRIKSLRENLISVGITEERVFEWYRVLYSKLNLPMFNIEWRETNLKDFSRKFLNEISTEIPTGQIVFLVGPYGTGKTTMAQYIFSECVKKLDGDSFLLTYKPSSRDFVFEWIPREGLVNFFRVNEISRVLSIEAIQWINYNIPFNKNIFVNLSELNAADRETIEEKMELIEQLIREIKEKLLPRKFVIFVSLQSYHLVSYLKNYFIRRPDLCMGRARLDTGWIIRGDVPQYLTRAGRGKGKTEFIEEIIKFLLKTSSEKYVRDVAKRILMPISLKRNIYLKKSEDIMKKLNKPELGYESRLIEAFRSLKVGIETESDEDDEEDEIKIDPLKLWDVRDPTLFKIGIGTYSTISLALYNGFIRQVIDACINEISLDYLEYRLISSYGTEKFNIAENYARSRIFDIINAGKIKGFELMNEEESKLDFLGKQYKIKLERYSNAKGGGEPFDLGFKYSLKKINFIHYYLVDITTKLEDRDEKGPADTFRLLIAWDKDCWAKESEAKGLDLELLIWVVNELTKPFRKGSRKDREFFDFTFKDNNKCVFVLDVVVDSNDPFKVKRFYLSIYLDENKINENTESKIMLEIKNKLEYWSSGRGSIEIRREKPFDKGQWKWAIGTDPKLREKLREVFT